MTQADVATQAQRVFGRLQALSAEIHRLIDVEYRWMLGSIGAALLIVPLPFTLYMIWRTRKRIRVLQAEQEAIAADPLGASV